MQSQLASFSEPSINPSITVISDHAAKIGQSGSEIAWVEAMAYEFFSLRSSGKTGTAIEDIHILLVDKSVVVEALQWVSGCERCTDHALIQFDYILDAVTGAEPASTEYVMYRPMKCPSCLERITEKTKITVC